MAIAKQLVGPLPLVTPHSIKEYRISFYVQENIYHTCIAVIKWAVLLMYARLFVRGTGHRRFKLALQTIALVVALWWLGVEMAIIFQCWPLQKIWLTTMPGKCIPGLRKDTSTHGCI